MTPPETVTRLDATEGTPTWWARYKREAAASGLSETALRVLDLDAEYVLRSGVLGAGHPTHPDSMWPSTRVRRGLVVGSVQSGKTASILGVTAKGLDARIDVVVLLTGTRVALWRQTLDRVLAQLDGWEADDPRRGQKRLMLPDPAVLDASRQLPGIDTLYHLSGAQVRRALTKRRPIICVVMKQADHLIRFGNELRDSLGDALSRLDRPIHLLCVDDEADDGSILDAVVEAGLEPDAEGLKQIPRHITRLWGDRAEMQKSFHERLFVTYLAYTATPQSNFLQSDHNPLSPREFVAALRTPFDRGEVEPPRTTTYTEPLGVAKYYTGGEVFYRRLATAPDGLCCTLELPAKVEFDSDSEYEAAVLQEQIEHLGEALRAYFVACAIRLLEQGKRISTVVRAHGLSREELRASSPSPSCMLVHPSAMTHSHLRTAQLISAWSHDPAIDAGAALEGPIDSEGRPVLDPDGLVKRVELEEEKWRAWLRSYEFTRQRLADEFTGQRSLSFGEERWGEVQAVLRREVFPHVRLSIINSSPLADDRPQFLPVRADDGTYSSAPDIMSIFVSGNVMSRGVTLEGLTTTLFLRGSGTPAADTQMQMQRWFGYRGTHLHWCRVFLYRDQLELFGAYHENDEALKQEVLEEMNRSTDSLPSPLVLEGPRFRATSKIANLRALPLCPGRQPFIRVLGAGEPARNNVEILADLLEQAAWQPLEVRGTERGLLRDGLLSLTQVAEILERFRYEDHSPTPDGRNHRRWASLERSLGVEAPTAPLFRPPSGTGLSVDLVSPIGCPYSIAAYLRLWSAALTRRAPGLFPTDDYGTPWSLINLPKYAEQAPRFYLGLRGGDEGVPENPTLASHGVRRVARAHEGSILKATWGTRNPGEDTEAYLGDHLFDYYVSGFPPPQEDVSGVAWRPRGHPGLLLFHVVRTADGDRLTAGICLPLGGPDHFAAIAPHDLGLSN